MSKRKQHAPEFKAKVALEALKGRVEGTVAPVGLRKPEQRSDLASRFGVHRAMINQWSWEDQKTIQ